jgi:hypothetical protein
MFCANVAGAWQKIAANRRTAPNALALDGCIGFQTEMREIDFWKDTGFAFHPTSVLLGNGGEEQEFKNGDSRKWLVTVALHTLMVSLHGSSQGN